ncbi:uncharacterized protein LOC128311866 isoform X2 [Acinonyx jubatus]|uniref:Uncharacterized protein LOC128311866 isoform X2 n=1 Tax=Acinonyx jubatus TaxID=32536 RepID=A0ABM3NJT7_ACIJB|nr:uncharacterized protein LOC128311866 isoform X2 [Acinonyx jubatus]
MEACTFSEPLSAPTPHPCPDLALVLQVHSAAPGSRPRTPQLLPKGQGLRFAGSGLAPNPSRRPPALSHSPGHPQSAARRPAPSLTWAGWAGAGQSSHSSRGRIPLSAALGSPDLYMAFPSSRPSRETSGKLEMLPEGAPAQPKKKKKKKQPKTSPRPPWLPPLPLRALTRPLGPTAPQWGGGARWEPPAERPGTGPHDLRCAWTLRRLRTFPVLEATVPSLAVKCGAVIRCFLPICATDTAEKRTKSPSSRMYMMRRKHAGCDFFLPPYSLPADKHRHRAPDPSRGLRPLYQLFRGSHWSLEKVQAPSLPSSPCIRSASLQRQF